MNWIAAAGIELSHGDKITREVHRALLADDLLPAAMDGGIRRVHVWAANPTGTFRRMLVASILRTEEGKISRRVRGEHKVGAMVEFFDPNPLTEFLDEDDPSIDAILVRAQQAIDAWQPLRLLVTGSAKYETITLDPKSVIGANGESVVAFFVGLEIGFKYSLRFPEREFTT